MILLLGGTGAARRLAQTLAPKMPIIASLSGATKSPKAYPCETRTGGFGGAQAMAAWLHDNDIAAIIDATHPFAAQISAHAVEAAQTAAIPAISLLRPEWQAREQDDWHHVPDLAAAVDALPQGARAFFATGRGGLETIKARTDIWAALRIVDDPAGVFPGNGTYIIARPPFDLDAEVSLFRHLGITHIVAKNAGGDAARTKLDAAAALHLPVLMIDRPEGARAPALAADDIPEWAMARLSDHHAAKLS